MSAPALDPLAILEAGTLLSTADAVAWLAERGIVTSRQTIAAMRQAGELRAILTRGRTRIMFTPNDLAAAFISEDRDTPWQNAPLDASRQNMTKSAGRGSSMARLPEHAFAELLQELEKPKPKREK